MRNVIDAGLVGVRYDRMVFSWSGVGGDSTTWRLMERGGLVAEVGGYGPLTAERRSETALAEDGEVGLWLGRTWWFNVGKSGQRRAYKMDISGWKEWE